MPVLLLVGSDAPDGLKHDPETVAAALPDARIEVRRQRHIAHRLVPEMFARHVLARATSREPRRGPTYWLAREVTWKIVSVGSAPAARNMRTPSGVSTEARYASSSSLLRHTVTARHT
ncbi:MAG: hypothetical protein M3O70_12010 [Actinomycetota bacterium]|nr:hypothetical protein [Actinomycetota bacterium]